MQDLQTRERTIGFIRAAHFGQKDKRGRDYWLHPVEVEKKLHDLPGTPTEPERLVALLHDVIEDTRFTADDLLALGYSQTVVDAVQMLSRPQGPTYLEWINDIATSGNRIVMRVKLADNLANFETSHELPEHERGIGTRYEQSIRILKTALGYSQDGGWG